MRPHVVYLFSSRPFPHKGLCKADPEGDCRPPIAFEFRSWSKCLQTLPGSCAKVLDNCPVIYIIRKKVMEAGLLDYLYQARQSVPNGLCTRERRANGQPVRRSNRVSVNSFVPRGILVFVIHSCVQYP